MYECGFSSLNGLNGRGAVAMNLSALFLPVSTTRDIPSDARLSSALNAFFAFIANVIALLE
jgi:hypothetical protein